MKILDYQSWAVLCWGFIRCQYKNFKEILEGLLIQVVISSGHRICVSISQRTFKLCYPRFICINDQRVNLPLLMLSSQLVNPPQIINPAFSSISFSRYNFFHRNEESLPVLTRGLSTLHLRQSKTSLPNLSYHITVPLCGLLLAVTRNHIDFTSSLSCFIASNYS